METSPSPTASPVNTEKSPVKRSILETMFLYSRYVLVLFYVLLGWGLIKLLYIQFRMVTSVVAAEDLTHHMIYVLELVDITLLANLVWFIMAGGFYVFVSKFPFSTETNRPRCLTHVSAGLLKEKTASSIVSIALISLLKLLFETVSAKGDVDWVKATVALSIFSVLLLALWLFSHVESLPHHSKTEDN